MERSEKWEQLMKESILSGVIGVLTERGSEGLTMKRVAEEAGVAKGTLYAYFDNKAELLEAAVQATLQPLIEEITAILKSDLEPDAKLRKLVDRHLTYFEENRDKIRVLLYERHKVLGKRARFESSRYHCFVDHIASVITEGVDKGLFRPLEPVKVAVMLMEANISIIHQRLFGEERSPIAHDRDLILDIFLHGLLRAS